MLYWAISPLDLKLNVWFFKKKIVTFAFVCCIRPCYQVEWSAKIGCSRPNGIWSFLLVLLCEAGKSPFCGKVRNSKGDCGSCVYGEVSWDDPVHNNSFQYRLKSLKFRIIFKIILGLGQYFFSFSKSQCKITIYCLLRKKIWILYFWKANFECLDADFKNRISLNS